MYREAIVLQNGFLFNNLKNVVQFNILINLIITFMKKMYLQRAALTLGIAAFAATGANAGAWRNINSQLTEPSFIPGWSGALTATADGVAEVYNGAFEIYQVISDAPAGKYTLTANAFYRYASNDESRVNMTNGANHNAYLFLGDKQVAVMGLFDETIDVAPNSTGEANTAFSSNKYLNTVEFDHKGGDLKLGIKNLGGRFDEWCCFDNFKLNGPNGAVEIPNGDFSNGLVFTKNATLGTWDINNVDGAPKTPEINVGGGAYAKTNASAWNYGQKVELAAGKYRFGVQSFLRHGGAGNVSGKYVTCKGAWGWVEGESPLDRHNNSTESEENYSYVWVTNGDDDGKPADAISATHVWDDTKLDWGAEIPGKWYKETPIKCMFDENLDVYPDNEPVVEGNNEDGYGWVDSGWQYQVAKLFVNNPELYRNYVEFELTEPATIWVGIKKDKNNPAQYWNPFRDFTLEKWDETAEGSGVADLVVEDENAPVEYYNLQGIRVANPENGLYIVKQGNKVTKRIIK